jgi:hypothetical protein
MKVFSTISTFCRGNSMLQCCGLLHPPQHVLCASDHYS